MIGEHTLYDIIPFQGTKVCLWPSLCSILEHVPCALVKNMYSDIVDGVFYKCLSCLLNLHCCSSLIHLCWSSAYLFYPLLKVVYWSPNYSCCGTNFWICNGKLNMFIFGVRKSYFHFICIATSLAEKIFHVGQSLLSSHICKY